MGAVGGAGGDGVERLQAGHQFAGGKALDLEPAVGGLGDELRHLLGGAEDGVERLGKLDVRRHVTSGWDCATAGLAIAVAVAATAAPLRNVRLSMVNSSPEAPPNAARMTCGPGAAASAADTVSGITP